MAKGLREEPQVVKATTTVKVVVEGKVLPIIEWGLSPIAKFPHQDQTKK
jgi:hypothetical protein